MSSDMGSNTTLVTGGAGFIGSAMAQQLLEAGDDVVVVDNLYNGKRENVPNGAEFVESSIIDKQTYDDLSKYDIDSVFHLGAQSGGPGSFNDPEYDRESHIKGTFNLLQWCKESGVDRILYASSMSVYGEPETLPVSETAETSPKTYYAAGKRGAEAYIRLFDNMGLNTTIFRLFNVYGPNQNLDNRIQGMVSIYLSYVLQADELVVKGSLDRVRDFIFIDDVVEAWMKAKDNHDTFGETFNLATGRPTTVGELIKIMVDLSGNPDFPVEVTDGTPGDQFAIYGDISKVTEVLDWSPNISVEEGLKKMVNSEQD